MNNGRKKEDWKRTGCTFSRSRKKKQEEKKNRIQQVKKLETKAAANQVEDEMKISKVEPNREQPRKKFDEDALLELSESIKQFGVLTAILVQKKKITMRSLQGNGDGELQNLPE